MGYFVSVLRFSINPPNNHFPLSLSRAYCAHKHDHGLLPSHVDVNFLSIRYYYRMETCSKASQVMCDHFNHQFIMFLLPLFTSLLFPFLGKGPSLHSFHFSRNCVSSFQFCRKLSSSCHHLFRSLSRCRPTFSVPLPQYIWSQCNMCSLFIYLK